MNISETDIYHKEGLLHCICAENGSRFDINCQSKPIIWMLLSCRRFSVLRYYSFQPDFYELAVGDNDNFVNKLKLLFNLNILDL